MENNMITLLILLNICHWAADYTHLSTKWMLDAKRIGSPLMPILSHACVHGMLMFFPLFFMLGSTWLVPILVWFQIGTHFGIDVLKGKLNVWFPTVSNPANKSHWYIFGLDQLCHQLVIITMVQIANTFYTI